MMGRRVRIVDAVPEHLLNGMYAEQAADLINRYGGTVGEIVGIYCFFVPWDAVVRPGDPTRYYSVYTILFDDGRIEATYRADCLRVLNNDRFNYN